MFGNEEKKIISVIKKVMPAVVSITVSKKESLKKSSIEDLNEDNDFIDGGSGFIAKQNGVIFTNRHVISDPDARYTVVLDSGDEFEADLLARDPLDDLAILKIRSDRNNFPVIELGDSNDINLGEKVLALGNVLGLFKNTVSSGIISGLTRSITAQIDKDSKPSEMRGLIQTDAAINPGNSGGPLINLKGKAIGINVAMIAGLENVGFALPINVVKRDLKDLEKDGQIRRPFLGVRYLTINKELSEKLNLPVEEGSLIIKDHSFDKAVVKGSPADKAGIEENDIILEWNGDKITPNKNIQDHLSSSEVGERISIKILRKGKEETLAIILGERK